MMLPKRCIPFQVAIVLCGLPASGKSSLAARLAPLLQGEGDAGKARIIDIDAIRLAVYKSMGKGPGDCESTITTTPTARITVSSNKVTSHGAAAFVPEHEAAVRQRKLDEIDHVLARGSSVIDDDMNYFRSMRKEVADIACNHRVHYAIIHVDTPIKHCLGWNAHRDQPVPDEIIKDVAGKFDKPGSRAYSWDEPLVTVNLQKLGLDGAVMEICKELETAAIRLPAKHPVMALLGDSSSVLGNVAFWNLAMLGRIIDDGFMLHDIQEWKDSIQRSSASVLDRFEVETRRVIGAMAGASGSLSPVLIKDVKRFKQDAMKVLKKDPARFDALIDAFKAMVGMKEETRRPCP